jgi:hypothetical protein
MNGAEEAPGLSMPAAMASHDDWLSYAVSRGMPREQAKGSTRDRLRAAFVPEGAPRDDTPYIERLDQDVASRTAYREGRRPPWQQQ